MALSGMQIYKLLPRTNCKECGYPTCLAFAMKLAAKQAELAACPYVSDESKAKLEEASQPPIRLVSIQADGHESKAGNETVLFRHEKRFFNKPGLFVRLRDDAPLGELKGRALEIADYSVEYVGMDLAIDGIAIQATQDAATFGAAIRAIQDATTKPLILIAKDPAVMARGLQAVSEGPDENVSPLIYGATAETWEAFAKLSKQYKAPMAIREEYLDVLSDLASKLKEKGVDDIVLDHGARDMAVSLANQKQIRRAALTKNY